MLLLAAAAAAGAAGQAEGPPNFVFFLGDDWGWGDVGAYGASGDIYLTGTQTRTPTLDALAANGTMLTDFHADHLCCPSRVALMTGRFAGDVSVNGNFDVSPRGAAKNAAHGLAYQLPTPADDGASPWAGGLLNLGSLMKSHGSYKTAHLGKWHLGGCSPAGQHTPAPSEYGYDFTATHASPVEAGCVPSSLTDVNIGESAADLFPDKQWWSADVDGVASDLSISFIRNATREHRPFYVHFHLHASHATIDPRPEQIEIS